MLRKLWHGWRGAVQASPGLGCGAGIQWCHRAVHADTAPRPGTRACARTQDQACESAVVESGRYRQPDGLKSLGGKSAPSKTKMCQQCLTILPRMTKTVHTMTEMLASRRDSTAGDWQPICAASSSALTPWCAHSHSVAYSH